MVLSLSPVEMSLNFFIVGEPWVRRSSRYTTPTSWAGLGQTSGQCRLSTVNRLGPFLLPIDFVTLFLLTLLQQALVVLLDLCLLVDHLLPGLVIPSVQLSGRGVAVGGGFRYVGRSFSSATAHCVGTLGTLFSKPTQNTIVKLVSKCKCVLFMCINLLYLYKCKS